MKDIKKGWKDILGLLYDKAPDHINTIFDNDAQTLKINVKGSNLSQWPSSKSPVFVNCTGNTINFSIPKESITKIVLDAMDVVKTKKNSDGETDEDEFAVFIVGIMIKESTDYIPLSIEKKYSSMRRLSEDLAKFFQVDIIDDSGEKKLVRKLEDLDKPIWETMKEPVSIPRFSGGISYGAFNRGWKIKWHDKYKFSLEKNALLYKVKLMALIILVAILSWLFLIDFGFGGVLICIIAFIGAAVLPVKSHEIIFDSTGMKYTEHNLFNDYTENYNINKIEQISVLYGSNEKHSDDYTLSFIADNMSIDIPGSLDLLKKLKVLCECGVYDVHKAIKCRVPVYKENFISSFINNIYNFAVIASFSAGIILFFHYLLFSAPSQTVTLNRSGTDKTKWSGSSVVNLKNRAYQGRIRFTIKTDWGAEGDVDMTVKVTDTSDNKVVFEMDREYFIGSWNEESMISKIEHVGFGFTPKEGSYKIDVNAVIPQGNHESLYTRARAFRYDLVDYAWSLRMCFFLILFAIFCEILKPVSTHSVFSISMRSVSLLLIVNFMAEAYLVTSEPTFAVKKESSGYVYYVHSHGYGRRRPFRTWVGTRSGTAFRGSGGGK
jgi:hypothetical protein